MGVAVHGRARTVHFGHARDVIAAFQAQLALDGQAHFLAARLGPADHLAQPDLIADARALHFLGQQQGHGGRGPETTGAHVPEQLQMHFQIARSHRNGQHAEKLAAQLKARSGGPQAVAHSHLHAVLGRKPGQLVAAGHLGAERLDVAAAVGQNFALARGAAGGMDAHHVLFRHAEQGQGVALAQILHIHRGQLAQIIQAADILGTRAASIQPRPVLRGVARLAQGVAQAVQLDLPDLLVREPGNETMGRVGHGRSPLCLSGRSVPPFSARARAIRGPCGRERLFVSASCCSDFVVPPRF